MCFAAWVEAFTMNTFGGDDVSVEIVFTFDAHELIPPSNQTLGIKEYFSFCKSGYCKYAKSSFSFTRTIQG